MSRYEIIGPFKRNYVTVNGREVPFLDAFERPGGVISLLLDHRYGLDVPVDLADSFIPWIANAIAIAMGYNCHPQAKELDDAYFEYLEQQRRTGEPVRSNPFRSMNAITSVTTAAAPEPSDDPLAGYEKDFPADPEG